MSLLRICIWMNIPSHYQSDLFEAMVAREDVDLRVVYLHGASAERATEGWRDTHLQQPFETFTRGRATPANLDGLVPDWRDRIHLLGIHFFPELVSWFCEQRIPWCHWSEVPGIRLAELVGFRMPLYRLLNPLMLALKRRDGRLLGRHALGVFGQGRLAHRAFRTMGVPDQRIADLYYSPAPLQRHDPAADVARFAAGRKVILSVGALCRRKGIDVLLKAFARLDAPGWCLVLCGLDRANGAYRRLAAKLGVAERVLFLGAYPSDRIAEVYAAADLFVLASRFDGWGAVVNEAASLGLALVATDLCGAAWHVVEDGVDGYRVRAASPGSLMQALRRYVDDPELAARHGRAARLRYEEHFTPATNADRLVRQLALWSAR